MKALKVGIYRHYKSTIEEPKEYVVLGVGKDTETGVLNVIYKPKYENEWMGDADFCVRPLTMFCEEVDVDGQLTPRFTYIGLDDDLPT